MSFMRMGGDSPSGEGVPDGGHRGAQFPEAGWLFCQTHWSVVLAAAQAPSPVADASLEALCRAYWAPIYAYVRRRGYRPEDAQDLTQDFFTRLIGKRSLESVHPSKGRFRSFLLASLKHFLANEWDRAWAQKRGGGHIFFSVEELLASNAKSLEPADSMSAERAFDYRWAMTVLEGAMQRLREGYEREGKGALFGVLRESITQDSEAYAVLGSRLGMTEGAVKVAVSRLRKRYRETLRAQIAQTVAHEEQVEEELRSLIVALKGG